MTNVEEILRRNFYTGEPVEHDAILNATKELKQLTQQLVARIKRSSKYADQAPKGKWFNVRVVPDMGYSLRGNNNNYRFGDVVFGIRLDDGTVVELK